MEESIHLVLRLRPPRYDSRVFWTAKDTKVQGEEGEYNADAVYDSRSTNQDIFKKNVHNMVEQCCVGYNTAVMAYGQSGAGKTHTLLGGGAEDGLVSYVARQLFEEVEMQQKSSGRSFLVQLQILELYCEKIRDLLVDQSSSSDRKILEANNIPQVTDLKKVPITSADQALEIIRKAQSRRVVAETELNEQSSRSHAIIQLTIESSLTTDDKSRHKCRRSVMNIVDLAGSEHVGANSGSRAKEGNNINLSLMTLTKVINQLTEKSGQSHISYRDSKLTRLLKPCLGGNSNTLIICCVDPQNKAESLRTLKFSERLKLVTARVQVNEEEEGGQLAVLMSELERLRLELADMKEKKVKEDEEEKKKRLEELSAQFFYGSDLSKPGKIRAIRRQTIAAPRMMSFGRSPPRVEARLDAHRSSLKEEERTAVQAQVEAAVSTKMQDFTEQIGQLQSECANLQHRNTGLLREHDDHDQLVEANSNFVSALAELEMVVKDQSQQIQSLNESLERLSVKERKAVEKLKQQETDNARLVAFWKDQSQKANRDLRASESSCNSLKEAFDKLQLDKDAEIERLGRLLDSQKEISQADRRMHEKIKATLEDKIVEVKEENKKKALQLAAVQCDLNLARRDLEQNRTEFTSVVEKELALLRDQNSDLRVSADRLQTELEDTRLTVNRLKAELKTQTTVSDQAIKELHRVLSSQKMASASPSKEQMKREKGMERKIADLEDELEILKQKEKSWRPSIQVQNGDSEIKLARLSNKLSLMESQLDALKKEKQEADEKLQAADDNLQSKVNTLNNGIDKYNTLLAEHKMLAGKYMELKKKIGN